MKLVPGCLYAGSPYFPYSYVQMRTPQITAGRFTDSTTGQPQTHGRAPSEIYGVGYTWFPTCYACVMMAGALSKLYDEIRKLIVSPDTDVEQMLTSLSREVDLLILRELRALFRLIFKKRRKSRSGTAAAAAVEANSTNAPWRQPATTKKLSVVPSMPPNTSLPGINLLQEAALYQTFPGENIPLQKLGRLSDN